MLPKYDLIVLLSLMAMPALISSQSTFEEQCKYKGNHSSMCAIDTKNCFERMIKTKVGITECAGIFYGTEKLNFERGPVQFWMFATGWYKNLLPENVVYSILLEKEGEISEVEDCCDMKSNKTCLLPPRNDKKEKHIGIFPMREGEISWYCKFVIEETQRYYTFCEPDGELPCISFKNGEYNLRTQYVPYSRDKIKSRTDYCFFAVPQHYVPSSVNYTEGQPIRNVPGMTMITENGSTRVKRSSGEYLDCHEVNHTGSKEFQTHVRRFLDEDYGNTVCYGIRLFNYTVKYMKKPWCVKFKVEKKIEPLPIILSMTFLCIALLIVIALIKVYRMHHKQFAKMLPHLPDSVVASSYPEKDGLSAATVTREVAYEINPEGYNDFGKLNEKDIIKEKEEAFIISMPYELATVNLDSSESKAFPTIMDQETSRDSALIAAPTNVRIGNEYVSKQDFTATADKSEAPTQVEREHGDKKALQTGNKGQNNDDVTGNGEDVAGYVAKQSQNVDKSEEVAKSEKNQDIFEHLSTEITNENHEHKCNDRIRYVEPIAESGKTRNTENIPKMPKSPLPYPEWKVMYVNTPSNNNVEYMNKKQFEGESYPKPQELTSAEKNYVNEEMFSHADNHKKYASSETQSEERLSPLKIREKDHVISKGKLSTGDEMPEYITKQALKHNGNQPNLVNVFDEGYMAK